jgi:hypothetical protein
MAAVDASNQFADFERNLKAKDLMEETLRWQKVQITEYNYDVEEKAKNRLSSTQRICPYQAIPRLVVRGSLKNANVQSSLQNMKVITC